MFDVATPAGMRCKSLADGKLHVYSSADRVVVQVRVSKPTEEDVLYPACKAAVQLNRADVVGLLGELVEALRRLE
jgi:hypothetical protein